MALTCQVVGAHCETGLHSWEGCPAKLALLFLLINYPWEESGTLLLIPLLIFLYLRILALILCSYSGIPMVGHASNLPDSSETISLSSIPPLILLMSTLVHR